MSQHLSQELLERHRQRRANSEELHAIGDHLMACEICRQRSQTLINRSFSGPPQSFQTTAHLAAETIELCAEDRLGAEAKMAAEEHLSECLECRAEMLAWRSFLAREELAAQKPPNLVVISAPRPGWLERVRAWWPVRLSPAPTWAWGAVALLLVALGVGVLWQRRYGAQGPNQMQAGLTRDGYTLLSLEEDTSATMGATGSANSEQVKIAYQVMSDKKVALRWLPVTGAQEYEILVSKADYAGNECGPALSSGLEFTCGPLAPGTYHIQILPLKGKERLTKLAGRGILTIK